MSKKIYSLKHILFSHYATIIIITMALSGIMLYNSFTQVLIESKLLQSSSQIHVFLSVIDSTPTTSSEELTWRILQSLEQELNTPIFLLDNSYTLLYPINEKDNHLIGPVIKATRQALNHTILSIDSKSYYVILNTSSQSGHRLVQLIPQNEFSKTLNLIKLILFFIFLILLFPALSIMYLSTRKTMLPVLRLVDIVGYIENGQFSRRFIDKSTEESFLISKRINLMVERIGQLNRENLIVQKKSTRAEIKALQSQINPHFLFNTLNTIKSMALNEKTREISRLTTNLAEMLRYGIYNPDTAVSVERELDHVRAYLGIQSYRFGKDYQYLINCPEELKQMICMKLILQPMVENAIKHGMKNKKDGLIQISVEKKKMFLLLTISDNGNGIEETALQKIRSEIDDEFEERESIGIRNVHQRIRMKYGPRYGVTIVSKKGNGLSITISLPDSGYVKSREVVE